MVGLDNQVGSGPFGHQHPLQGANEQGLRNINPYLLFAKSCRSEAKMQFVAVKLFDEAFSLESLPTGQALDSIVTVNRVQGCL